MSTVAVFGGDGYLGWSIALYLAINTDHDVIVVDNSIKRQWAEQAEVEPLFFPDDLKTKVLAYRRAFNRRNLFYRNHDLTDFKSVSELIQGIQPEVVVNAAQQPSAPFAMMCPHQAMETYNNNQATTLNTLWAIAQHSPRTHYVGVGSAGVYQGTPSPFIPAGRFDFEFCDKTGQHHLVLDSMFPMESTDFYHQSKANTLSMTDMMCKMWNLRCTTVNQSTIYGCVIEDLKPYVDLWNYFFYDEIFGTVVNRFIAQSVVKVPMTVYHPGRQETGLISLDTAVKNYHDIIMGTPPRLGEHKMVFNVEYNMSITQLACMVQNVSGNEVRTVENPRIEGTKGGVKLLDQTSDDIAIQIFSTERLYKDLRFMLQFVDSYKSRINHRYIMPSVNWSPELFC